LQAFVINPASSVIAAEVTAAAAVVAIASL
jgi:hypothetical protein